LFECLQGLKEVTTGPTIRKSVIVI